MKKNSSKYQILTIPDWFGSNNPGIVEEGPMILAKSILSTSLKNSFQDKVIDIPLPDHDINHLSGVFEKTKFLPELSVLSRDIKRNISHVSQKKKVPLALIADDSSLIGIISGISEVHGSDIGVLYFDAHGDLNTPESTITGLIYGMPLAVLLGHGHPALTSLNDKGASIKAKNLLMIGTRSLDPGETSFISDNNIFTLPSDDARHFSSEDLSIIILDTIKKNGIKKLYIHVDLDVFDPEEIKGALLHEPDGLLVTHITRVIKDLKKKRTSIVGLSISEYVHSKDPSGQTIKAVHEIVKSLVS